jgi:hypothetical protein
VRDKVFLVWSAALTACIGNGKDAQWKGQFTCRDQKVPKMILEAVESHDLWIWRAFFGVMGSNNDIIVLNQSTLNTCS